MTWKTRIGAFWLAALTVFVMLFSHWFVAAEAEHDCTGAHCPVCEQMAACENILKYLSNGAAALAATAAVIRAGVMPALFLACAHTVSTPVSLKVKLLN